MKKKIKGYFLPIALWGTLGAIIIWQGCANSVSPEQQQLNQIVFPATNVSYSQDVQPMFNLACTYSGCHDDGTKAKGLSLTSWTNAYYSDAGVIIAGNPNSSKLCEVLEGKLAHLAPLDTIQNHVKGVHQWVLEGAKNN
ncbi:MAG TPA: hypothetical protein VFA55_05435 [Candidatus Kapabacteria bacterium]|nr:hypothetical protein [Candidatus Kapabacteria bacterium]